MHGGTIRRATHQCAAARGQNQAAAATGKALARGPGSLGKLDKSCRR